MIFVFVVFSSDDRSPSASTLNEKQIKTITNNQLKQEQILVPEDIKRPDINYLAKNIERIRIASLKNKYDLFVFFRENQTLVILVFI